ncbi:MAG: hypothetical protein GQ576_00435 [Methanococcoides sp.]|nr:hypothetical protein [Methanococcoides sp.]
MKSDIVNADTYMRVLMDWCIENKVTTITRMGLPEDLQCKWYRRSLASGYLRRVNDTKSCSGDTWVPSGKYMKMLNEGLQSDKLVKCSTPLSAHSVTIAISEGYVTCRQISGYLGYRFETTFQALRRLCDAGTLDRVAVRNVYNYSIKEL